MVKVTETRIELDEQAENIAHHLLKARSSLERAVQICEDSGAPFLVIDENSVNLEKINSVLSFYNV